jgi:hypothetical protein
MKHNENDFETEVKLYLMQKGRAKKPQLIEDLMKKHKNELGYSLKSIIRKLDNMRSQGIIKRIDYDNFEKYGIKDTDKRACYYILKSIYEIEEHIDNVLERLSSEEPMKQKMVLKEIARYRQMYFLNSEQLDLVVAQFCKGIKKGIIDDDLTGKLLFLLYSYILKKNIEPDNKTKTIDLLLNLLDKYPIPSSTNVNLRTHIIYLLGHYGHESVIEQLKKDARIQQDFSSIEVIYNSRDTAGLIEEHRDELYKLEEELTIEGKKQASQFVSNIRTDALINLGFLESPFDKEKEEGKD